MLKLLKALINWIKLKLKINPKIDSKIDSKVDQNNSERGGPCWAKPPPDNICPV